MTIETDQLTAWVLGFFWPFVRVSAMVMAAPLFGAQSLPARVRLMIALALTWVVLPLVGPVPQIDPLSPAGVLVTVNQLLIGAAMGLVLQIVFAALVVGGQMIAVSMGLGFAAVADPQNGIQVPVVSQLYFLLGALIFLAIDGHLVLIELVAFSFTTLPVGGSGLAPELFRGLALWSGLMFSEGMRLALPVIVAIKLTNLALGVATRAAPQLNVFSLGFAIMMLLGFVVMLVSLPNLTPLFTALLGQGFDKVAALLTF